LNQKDGRERIFLKNHLASFLYSLDLELSSMCESYV
jgi:hypothetical protein